MSVNIGKPLGRKAYGSIAHLPGSRLGPSESHISEGQERICTVKYRDKLDRVIVTEKLDGGNVAVAKVGGEVLALTRSGYTAKSSRYEQHHHFDWWVHNSGINFNDLLNEGDAIHGEWLCQAHGTIYKLNHSPFVAFDITKKGKRVCYDDLVEACEEFNICKANLVSDGPPISVEDALSILGDGAHGSTEEVEGLVYRVERKGSFDFLAKYVRPTKQDGKYLPELTGAEPIFHWKAPIQFTPQPE